jgi:hypothetical protein
MDRLPNQPLTYDDVQNERSASSGETDFLKAFVSENNAKNPTNSPNKFDASVLQQMIKCCHFAATKHARQRRKDPQQTPYINHPLGEFIVLLAIFLGTKGCYRTRPRCYTFHI